MNQQAIAPMPEMTEWHYCVDGTWRPFSGYLCNKKGCGMNSKSRTIKAPKDVDLRKP